MPRSTATEFHGAPTQKASTCLLARLSTMYGGGNTTSRTSSSGSTPPAAIQNRR